MSSLQGWYRFYGDFNDSSGNTRNGVAGGNASASDGVATFDGVNDIVTIDKAVISGDTFTICFWAFISSTQTAVAGYFCADGGDADNLFIRQANANQYFCGIGETQLDNLITVSRDAWHFNVIFHDTDGNYGWYIDDMVTAKETKAGSNFAAIQTEFNLGNRTDLLRDLEGLLRDFRVYNRVLAVEERQKLYNSSRRNPRGFNRGVLRGVA